MILRYLGMYTDEKGNQFRFYIFLSSNCYLSMIMNKAIFLDRDGIINQKKEDYVKSINELIILPHASRAIKKLNELGFLVVVVTNQSIINRKIISKDELQKINDFIVTKLEENGAKIRAIYFCPHIPEQNCFCRKPQPGLLFQALKELSIDPKQSFLIGDNEIDIEAARRVGIIGWQMETNGNLFDFIRDNLSL